MHSDVIQNKNLIEQLNQVLLASDEGSRLNLFSSFISGLEEDVDESKYELLNRLELHRDLALANNNSIKEILVYLMMLKLSSNCNLIEIEEKLHANFSIHDALKYDNLLKLIAKIDNEEFRTEVKKKLDEIEHTVIRLALTISTKNENDIQKTTQGSVLSRGREKENLQHLDETLLAKIAEYKNIVLQEEGLAHQVKEKEVEKTFDQKISEFLNLEVSERLWYIGYELLRRLGLTQLKIIALLPYERKLVDPGILEGSYSDNYIASEAGLWKISKKILSKITTENLPAIDALFENELDLLLGQIYLCKVNKKVFGVVERNYDFMPIYDANDKATLNLANMAFNDVISTKSSTDQWYGYIQMALQTIGESEVKISATKNIMLKLTGAIKSTTSQAIVAERSKIPLKFEEVSFFTDQ